MGQPQAGSGRGMSENARDLRQRAAKGVSAGYRVSDMNTALPATIGGGNQQRPRWIGSSLLLLLKLQLSSRRVHPMPLLAGPQTMSSYKQETVVVAVVVVVEEEEEEKKGWERDETSECRGVCSRKSRLHAPREFHRFLHPSLARLPNRRFIPRRPS